MNGGVFALLERVHGHLALLGLAALLHPVLLLRRGRSPALTAGLAAGLLGLATLGGWALYGSYRRQIKPELLLRREVVALAFEAKEHLAFLCIVLTVTGLAALRWAPGLPVTRRFAGASLATAWLLGFAAAILGLLVSASAAPAW